MKRFAMMLLMLCLPLGSFAGHFQHHKQTLKQVFFTSDTNKIIAVDINSRRNVEFRLRLKENILKVIETNVTIAVATDRRVFGFSQRGSGWVPIDLKLREQLLTIRAQDFAIFAETNQRILSFNALNGNWQARRKSLR